MILNVELKKNIILILRFICYLPSSIRYNYIIHKYSFKKNIKHIKTFNEFTKANII